MAGVVWNTADSAMSTAIEMHDGSSKMTLNVPAYTCNLMCYGCFKDVSEKVR